MKLRIVVSLFNGMSTGQQALHNQGITYEKYISSEIKPYAIKLNQHHFPETIQVGDITKWREWEVDWSQVDLILSGSPCQDLSNAGKKVGINGKKSSLFFVFIDIFNHIKSLNPNVLFLQENVGSSNKLDVGIMSREMGLYPVRINSSLVTAQLRDRYYWTNIKTKKEMFDIITDIPQPKDRKILFKDIITDGLVEKIKANCLLEGEAKTFGYSNFEKFELFIKKRQEEKRQVCNCVYVFRDKSLTLLESESRVEKAESLLKRVEKDFRNGVFSDFGMRPLNKIEICRLQGFPDDYCDILSRNQAGSLLGDGWTLPIIEHIFSFIPEKLKELKLK